MDSFKLILLNQYLSGRKFLGGEEPSKADNDILAPVKEYLRERDEDKLPKALLSLSRWFQALQAAKQEAPEGRDWPGDAKPVATTIASWPDAFVRQMIDRLDALLVAASVVNVECNRKQYLLNRGGWEFNSKNENIVFGHFINDLFSVLDHLMVLLYCHYKNNGQPDFSHDVLKIKFPFSDELQRSVKGDEEAQRAQRKNIIQGELEKIFGSAEGHEWFAKKIEKLQAHTLVSASGEKSFEILEDGSDKQVFNQLYFLNHYCSHRSLISISPEPKYVHLCVCSYPTVEITPHERHFEECPTKVPISRGLYVCCPEDPRRAREDEIWTLKPLPTMSDRFLHFVKIIRDEILKEYFNLPPFDKLYKVRGGYDDGFRVNQQFVSWDSFQLQTPVPIH